MIGRDDLTRRFAYHPPSSEQVKEAHSDVRSMCYDLAVEIDSTIPDGREKSLAITALEEVMMWANAGIARTQLMDASTKVHIPE